MKTETPMIRQYREIKEHNQDKILLFRVGDFYELFFDDAKIGARELEITLTARDKDVPLAGFPYHALNTYLSRLIERGYKVAICEQVEDPKQAKGIVKREIVQVITPGTVTETSLLDEKSNNYLVSVYVGRGGFGLAAVDVSTGQFVMSQERGSQAARFLADELCRLNPAEIIVNEGAKDNQVLTEAMARLGTQVAINPCRDKNYALKQAQETLLSQFAVQNLDSLGCADLFFAVSAAGAALAYLHDNRQGNLSHLQQPEVYNAEGYMVLDAATRRNLELTRTIREERKYGSLLWVLDKTRSALGGRLLKRWLEQPLLDKAAICERLDAVEELAGDFLMLDELSELLDEVYDLERLLSKVHYESANARDLVALRSTLAVLPAVREKLLSGGERMQTLARHLPVLEDLSLYLTEALCDDPPLSVRDGGLVRDRFHPDVDKLRHACRHGRDYILSMEQRERERTGIKSLKVGYNKVFGYYIEITRANAHLTPDDYIRKQTLANAERYITPELKEYEATVLGAEEKICALEYELFQEVRRKVGANTMEIQEAAAALAQLDVFQSLARVARDYRYVRPQVDDGDVVDIREGRHPVVERVMQDSMFVPNDTRLDRDNQRLLMITGPNMAGKSTYMRQTALIVLLAQVGSFVPAASANIGLVDRIFTRIGAADDLVGGQSTFMVEMSEVANILSRATDKSLVLLDEVGRGTSTFDGISIARAVVEHLYGKVGARTLFATHYHELTDLASDLPAVQNMATAVKEKGEDIVFLHKVIAGSVDHSYGIQVARLAGLPQRVISRSREILNSLESPTQAVRETAAASEAEQMRLFMPDPELTGLMDEVQEADLMTTTPLEAMQMLYKLQQALKKGNEDG
ncbi:DNA mismatch repair protein MutS [Dethiobacter alkaliphilus]|uniref:DNA mismatch repair protein MutS n=1 Tax=Dethiobacter alkaliphilus AHT 1 TaxID=555088 RepID=C0GDR0_DETAL|nr:DNA mismatch repair protein MutS [Dethiobacter alkaliphilus]EEG78543.1 DNA mismatch repair protein MutS [Dethiobacter alkaliphilus AHT 1]